MSHEQKQISVLRRIKSQDIDNQNISLHPLFAAPPKSYDLLEGLVIFLCFSAPRIGLLSTPAYPRHTQPCLLSLLFDPNALRC